MAVSTDPAPELRQYAHPERLVTTRWLAEHLGDDGLVVIESDEDVRLYETGHIRDSVDVDWRSELNNQATRDYIGVKEFGELCSARGIDRDTTLVFYGDSSNWWATYALWVFSLFGHADVRLLNGGRQKWSSEGREYTRDLPRPTRSHYEVARRNDAPIRAFRDQITGHIENGYPLVDVRGPREYTGEVTTIPHYPQEGAQRGGHIPGARNVPWDEAVQNDGTFKTVDQLKAIYAEGLGLGPEDDIVSYCRIGERSSHTWFVLQHLLGFPRVRNYDGSWAEWGNLVRSPIAQGTEAGALMG